MDSSTSHRAAISTPGMLPNPRKWSRPRPRRPTSATRIVSDGFILPTSRSGTLIVAPPLQHHGSGPHDPRVGGQLRRDDGSASGEAVDGAGGDDATQPREQG